eukprot:745805-Hanusia_phi.AAC.4
MSAQHADLISRLTSSPSTAEIQRRSARSVLGRPSRPIRAGRGDLPLRTCGTFQLPSTKDTSEPPELCGEQSDRRRSPYEKLRERWGAAGQRTWLDGRMAMP